MTFLLYFIYYIYVHFKTLKYILNTNYTICIVIFKSQFNKFTSSPITFTLIYTNNTTTETLFYINFEVIFYPINSFI